MLNLSLFTVCVCVQMVVWVVVFLFLLSGFGKKQKVWKMDDVHVILSVCFSMNLVSVIV